MQEMWENSLIMCHVTWLANIEAVRLCNMKREPMTKKFRFKSAELSLKQKIFEMARTKQTARLTNKQGVLVSKPKNRRTTKEKKKCQGRTSRGRRQPRQRNRHTAVRGGGACPGAATGRPARSRVTLLQCRPAPHQP